jgi:hypothetical protein
MDSDSTLLAGLFLAVQDESSQAYAETEIESLLQSDRSSFVVGCADVIRHAGVTLLVSTALFFFQRAMAPNADTLMAAIREAWASHFRDEDRESIKGAVFGGMRHADPSIRESAIGAITLLFSIARENSPDILSDLLALINSSQDDDNHFPGIALRTLCAIYNSGVICELPAHLTLNPLRAQIEFFLQVIGAPRDFGSNVVENVLLTMAALIRVAPELFRPEAEQDRLLVSIAQLGGQISGEDVLTAMYGLLQADFQTFYGSEPFPTQQIPRLVMSGINCGDAPFVGSSLRFCSCLCAWEFEMSRRNERIAQLEYGLEVTACAAARPVPDLRPWSKVEVQDVAAVIAEHEVDTTVQFLFDPAALQEYDSDACHLLHLLCAHTSARVFDSITTAILTQPQDSPSYNGARLRCLDVLCSSPVSETDITTFIVSELGGVQDYAVAAIDQQDVATAELALSVLADMIRRTADVHAPGTLFQSASALWDLTCDSLLLPFLRFFTAICHCPAAKHPDFGLDGLLTLSTANFYTVILRLDDCESSFDAIRETGAFIDLVVSLLPPGASQVAKDTLNCVMEKLEESATVAISDIVRALLQQSYLSTIAVLFRVHAASLVEDADPALWFVLARSEQGVISVCEDLIAALTQIAFALPPAPPASDADTALYHFAARVFQPGDVKLTAASCSLMAHVIRRLPHLTLVDLNRILQVVCDSIQAPSCLAVSYPQLLTGLASILDAITIAIPDRILAACVTVCQIPVCEWDTDDIEFSNTLYRSIFQALGAVMKAAGANRPFLSGNQRNWLRVIRLFARGSILYMDHETLRCYSSYISLAVDKLTMICWPALAQIHVRLPLIMGVVCLDEKIRTVVNRAWRKFFAKE